MSEIGALSVRIGAETSGLQRGLSQAQGRMQGFQRSIMPTIKAMAAVGAAATGAATAIFAFGRAGMNAIDEQAKLARSLDGTIGGLRGLELAAADAGIAKGTLTSAVQRLSGRLGEAERGTGRAADAMETLGLRARDLNSMDVDQRMAAIADRIHEMGLSAAQTAALLRDMGIRQTEMVLLMRQGGDAIRDARQEVEDYGLAIDAVDAGMIEAANDAFSRLGLVMESIRSALAVEIAPIVLELAERFNTAAREAGGWGNVVRQAAEFAIRAFGTVADAIHRVRLANAAVERGTAELNLAFSRFAENAWTAMSGLFDNIVGGLNLVIAGFNRLPGVAIEAIGAFSQSDFMGRIKDQTDQATQAAWNAREAYAELANQRLPSEGIEEFFDAIEARRQALDDQIAEDGGFIPGLFDDEDGALGGGGGADGGQSEQQAEELDRLREHLARRLEMLREGLLSEEELERERFHERLEELAALRELEMIDQQEHLRLLENAQEEHADKMNSIEERASRERIGLQEEEARARQAVQQGMMNNLVSLMNSGSREMFNIGKVAAVAQALLAGREAIVSSYAAGARIGGPPLGAAFAATAAAATAAQIASVRATSFSGGGSTTASGGSGRVTDSVAEGPQQPQQQQQGPAGGTLTVEGITASSIFSGDAVRELAEELISYQQRGGRIVIA